MTARFFRAEFSVCPDEISRGDAMKFKHSTATSYKALNGVYEGGGRQIGDDFEISFEMHGFHHETYEQADVVLNRPDNSTDVRETTHSNPSWSV